MDRDFISQLKPQDFFDYPNFVCLEMLNQYNKSDLFCNFVVLNSYSLVLDIWGKINVAEV